MLYLPTRCRQSLEHNPFMTWRCWENLPTTGHSGTAELQGSGHKNSLVLVPLPQLTASQRLTIRTRSSNPVPSLLCVCFKGKFVSLWTGSNLWPRIIPGPLRADSQPGRRGKAVAKRGFISPPELQHRDDGSKLILYLNRLTE